MSLISDPENNDDHVLYDENSVGDIDSDEASPKFFKWDRYANGPDDFFQFKPLNFN